MITPGYYTQAGIELAQQGRKPEALAYLRQAVNTEPTSAEVWLWLAHVTPDVHEYRYCVRQALNLQPGHPTAQRMQQDLDYQSGGMSPPVQASGVVQTLEETQSKGLRWRRILILLNAIVMVAIIGRVGMSASENEFLNDRWADLKEILSLEDNSTHRLNFEVGKNEAAFQFEVEVPQTWFPADTGSPSWREQRDRLDAEFPANGVDFWREIQTDPGEVLLNPNTGEFSKAVYLVETDFKKLSATSTLQPANLRLVGIQNLPEGIPNTGCVALGELAKLEADAAQEKASFEKSDVVARSSEDCIYYLEYRDSETHFWDVRVPVGANRLAIWQITVPDKLSDDYKAAAKRILNTLRYLE